MIKAQADKSGRRTKVTIDATAVELANEFAAICNDMMLHHPLIFAVVMDRVLPNEEEEETAEEHTLDDLFEECMNELDLMMKVRGDNNAKS